MKASMTYRQYRRLCNQLGTRGRVATRLGVQRECMSKRCNNRAVITIEAALAIQYLHELKKAGKPWSEIPEQGGPTIAPTKVHHTLEDMI